MKFTIETTYRLPIYRQTTYEADTLEEALELAANDDDWNHEQHDYDNAGAEEPTGAWIGDEAYSGPDLLSESHGANRVRHDADGFYVLTHDEALHEDAGNASVGFDGRPHFATIEAAWLSATAAA